MSHFTKVETKIKSAAMFEKAACKLGLTKKVDAKEIIGFMKKKTKVDIAWQVPSSDYEVGLVKNKETGFYELVADWWGVGLTMPDLQQKLIMETNAQVVMHRAKILGHKVTRTTEKNGSIRLVIQTG